MDSARDPVTARTDTTTQGVPSGASVWKARGNALEAHAGDCASCGQPFLCHEPTTNRCPPRYQGSFTRHSSADSWTEDSICARCGHPYSEHTHRPPVNRCPTADAPTVATYQPRPGDAGLGRDPCAKCGQPWTDHKCSGHGCRVCPSNEVFLEGLEKGHTYGKSPTQAYEDDLNLIAEIDNALYSSLANLRPKDSNPKTAFGLTKPPMGAIPASVLVEVAQAMREGDSKYGRMNWRQDPVSASTYHDALLRHVAQWADGEDRDPKSQALHLAHAMSNLMILIDAAHCGTLIDDRVQGGHAGDLIRSYTRPLANEEGHDLG